MRLRTSTLLLAATLAACATPAPPPSAPPPPVVASAPAPAAPAVEPALPLPDPPKVFTPKLFDSELQADLEPLPPPQTDLWDRIVRGYRIPDLPDDDPLVAKWEQWYSDRPDYVARMVDRSRRYLYHIVTEIEARGMPLDLALLPMVESAFNPTALSSSRASGIWQFIPSTGAYYGLKQNWWLDARRDVVAATDSALGYLSKLHGDFGDWQLALAAYNWGEGNVGRAISRNQAKGIPTGYSGLPMPDETRNYLPKLQAIKNIVRDPEKYGLTLAEIPDTPYFTVVKLSRVMDVKVAAELAEMPLDEFLSLNPQHNRPVIAGADEYSLLLPIDKAELFAAKLELTRQPLVTWQAYRMRSGETLAQVASKYAIPVEALRAVNGIGAKVTSVPAGHALLVPAQQPSEASADSLSSTVFTTVPSGRTFYHQVKRGESLTRIATQYGVTTDDLRRWNRLPQNAVQVGQNLRITSDAVTGGKARARSGNGKSKSAPAKASPVKAAPSASAAAPSTRRAPNRLR